MFYCPQVTVAALCWGRFRITLTHTSHITNLFQSNELFHITQTAISFSPGKAFWISIAEWTIFKISLSHLSLKNILFIDHITTYTLHLSGLLRAPRSLIELTWSTFVDDWFVVFLFAVIYVTLLVGINISLFVLNLTTPTVLQFFNGCSHSEKPFVDFLHFEIWLSFRWSKSTSPLFRPQNDPENENQTNSTL